MILRTDSLAFRFIVAVSSPTMYLPQLFPLRIEPCRVGTNTTDYARLFLKRYPR
jgi:hypothetical protein